MKRLTALLAAAVLLLSACGKKQTPPPEDQNQGGSAAATMTISQTRFSQDTEDVLKLLDLKGGFYDSR